MRKIYIFIVLALLTTQLQAQTEWQKNETNPVVVIDQSWEQNQVIPGRVIYDGGNYHMWYGGSAAGEVWEGVGHATSVDGITWVKDTANPVLALSEPVAFDDTRLPY